MAFIKYSEGKITDVVEKGKEIAPKTKEAKEALEKYEEIRKKEKKESGKADTDLN